MPASSTWERGLLTCRRDRIGDAFDELFAMNVKGYLLGVKAALPELQKTKGSVIFTASQAGMYPGAAALSTPPRSTPSSASCASSLSSSARDIRLNAVAPTGVQTDLRGLSSLGSSELSTAQRPHEPAPAAANHDPAQDHAGAYVYLASKENSGLTMGAIMDTTNGMVYRRFALAAAGGEDSPWL